MKAIRKNSHSRSVRKDRFIDHVDHIFQRWFGLYVMGHYWIFLIIIIALALLGSLALIVLTVYGIIRLIVILPRLFSESIILGLLGGCVTLSLALVCIYLIYLTWSLVQGFKGERCSICGSRMELEDGGYGRSTLRCPICE